MGGATSSDDDIILEARNLTKIYGHGDSTVRAVDGVDLTVRRGEIVLIMGPSGAGKTTLLTMIGGLLHPTEGTVRISGRELTAMKESELAQVRSRLIGFVFQSFNLLDSLNAVENVEVALNLAGKSGRSARQKAERILTELGMAERLQFKPRALSGGEKQRVSIARALANDPELILADEPTANLDSRRGHEVVVLLRDLAKRRGHTVVIVSHDQRIQEVADRVLWMEDGRLRDLAEMAHDPVCGTAVDKASAPRVTSGGETRYFCSEGCQREFQRAPERFMSVRERR